MFARAKPAVQVGSDSEDDVTPGPGQYHQAARKQRVPENRQFFGSTVSRFKPTSAHVVGPGEYEVGR